MLVTWIATINPDPWGVDTFAMLFMLSVRMAPTSGYVEHVSSEYRQPLAGRWTGGEDELNAEHPCFRQKYGSMALWQ
jgi:hypothetical protein